MDFTEYAVAAVTAFTYLICAILKPFLKDGSKYLPLIAGVLGIVGAVWSTGDFNFTIVLSGLASGLGATGIDQLTKMVK